MANFSHDLSDWLSISFDSEWLEENIRWKDFGTGVRLCRIAREDTTSLVLYDAASDVDDEEVDDAAADAADDGVDHDVDAVYHDDGVF